MDAYRLRRHDRRVAAMLADPECSGDLLLVGLVLARWLDFTYLPGGDVPDISNPEVEQIAFGGKGRRALQAVLDDTRRYDPSSDVHQVTRCESPFTTSTGACASPAVKKALLHRQSGERRWVGTCLTHAVGFNTVVATQDATAVPVTGVANAGGVLARHLPEFDWPELYRSFNKSWKPPREAPPEGQRRPMLSIVGSPIVSPML